jgi:hypothetical protein
MRSRTIVCIAWKNSSLASAPGSDGTIVMTIKLRTPRQNLPKEKTTIAEIATPTVYPDTTGPANIPAILLRLISRSCLTTH